MELNDLYRATTAAEFVAWYDAVRKDLIGNYPAKSEALDIAVELLRECARRGNKGGAER